MAKRVTLHDVAALAGVSHTTVSWVIHDDPRISPETKARVVRAIAELNYHPNQAARSLVRGRSNVIAVVSSSYDSAFETETLRGISQELVQRAPQLELVQYMSRSDQSHLDRILNRVLYGGVADGLICLDVVPPPAMAREFSRLGKPLVVFEDPHRVFFSVYSDGDLGSRLAVQHLLEAGCRKLALVGGSVGPGGSCSSTAERREAAYSLCREWGLPEPADFRLEGFRFEEGEALARELLDGGYDGVFCPAGDLVALGLMAGAEAQGQPVPRSFLLVGYDDLLISRISRPSLSTIHQPLVEMGRQALGLCLDHLGHEDWQPEALAFEPKLVVRSSSQRP